MPIHESMDATSRQPAVKITVDGDADYSAIDIRGGSGADTSPLISVTAEGTALAMSLTGATNINGVDLGAAPANVPLTTPSTQDVIDALIALGLVEQSDA